MLAYIIRRLLYAVPILIGVNLITFLLFFAVSSPEEMAKQVVGSGQGGRKESADSVIKDWMEKRDYHYPPMFNRDEEGLKKITETLFWKKSILLMKFDFGKSDVYTDEKISGQILDRMWPSLNYTIPIFLLGLIIQTAIALLVAYFRGTYLDFWTLVICVLSMSVSALFYIIVFQYFFSYSWNIFPISGYATGLESARFIALPVIIGVVGGIGAGVRFDRTVFLEEVNRDYIRTARAKGLGEIAVLFKHALKNAMIPILTTTVVSIPFLFMGSLLTESFFGIPGMGGYIIDAIYAKDFAAVRAMVYLGSLLYIIAQLLTDISYTLVDPRVRLE